MTIDEVLAAGRKAVNLYNKSLAELIRLEYTERGPRFSVLGTFSEPTNISWQWPIPTEESEAFDVSQLDMNKIREVGRCFFVV